MVVTELPVFFFFCGSLACLCKLRSVECLGKYVLNSWFPGEPEKPEHSSRNPFRLKRNFSYIFRFLLVTDILLWTINHTTN